MCLGLNITRGVAEQLRREWLGVADRAGRGGRGLARSCLESQKILHYYSFTDLLRNFNNIYVMFLILRNVRSRYRVN